MSIFNELKQQLTQQLSQIKPSQGWVELRAEFTMADEINLLSWLKGQSHFPQSFWQSRSGEPIFATLGEAAAFEDLPQAEQFSQQTGFSLFGGVQFEGLSRLILPRLRLTKISKNLTACLYLDSSKFDSEQAKCQTALAEMAQIEPLQPVANRIVQQTAVSDLPRWVNNVEQAINAIEQQLFRKVVLANATRLECEKPLSPYDLLAASQLKNLGCYHFLWAEEADSAFVGSSPERLYRRHDRQFETEALAGTVAVSEDLAETEQNGKWLLQDPKNRYENQLVVDDIQQQLADLVSEFRVDTVELKRLPNVQHLRRPIRATLNPKVSDADCLSRIHPTAAVAGLPRSPAAAFIQQNEGFQRGWYAAALGYFNPQQGEFCVALRSATVEPYRLTLYAGAGIVAGSEAVAEWQEIERKVQSLLKIVVA